MSKAKHSSKFDPNAQALPSQRKTNYDWRWATYVPGRSPKFKIHGSRGLAISAIRIRYLYNFSTKQYELKDQEIGLYTRENTTAKWVRVPIKQTLDERGERSIFLQD